MQGRNAPGQTRRLSPGYRGGILISDIGRMGLNSCLSPQRNRSYRYRGSNYYGDPWISA